MMSYIKSSINGYFHATKVVSFQQLCKYFSKNTLSVHSTIKCNFSDYRQFRRHELQARASGVVLRN